MSVVEVSKKVGVTCPRCGSDNFDLGDYTHHVAYDDVVDAINASNPRSMGFSVWAECKDCGACFYIQFDITGITLAEEE